jgi:hypothetical protein
LSFFQTFEAQPLQWRLLGMGNARFHFALAIWILHAARQSDSSTVLQQIAVQRIDRGVVDIRREHTFAQIVQHHDTRGPT